MHLHRYLLVIALFVSMIAAFGLVACQSADKADDGATAGAGKKTPNVLEAPKQPPAQAAPTLGFSDVAEEAVKGVVNISSTKVVKTPSRNSPFSHDPFFRRFFGNRFPDQVPRERRERSRGSGVIIATDGYILTNNHVVEDATEVLVVLYDQREFVAQIVGTDPKSDVAVLKIDATDLDPLTLGRSADLRLGEVVLAIGNPFGLSHTVTQGIVSALGRARVGIADYEDFIQTDAAINPGNSGGALVNTRGELVGINTAIASMTGGYQGVGFAIPVDMARVIMDSLVQHGRVERGYLGVLIQDVRQDMVDQFGLKKPRGAIIADVLKEGPADEAGLQRGDVVIEMDGLNIQDSTHLRNLISQKHPDDKVELLVVRDRTRRNITITIGRHPDDAAAVPTSTPDQEPVSDRVTLSGLTAVTLSPALANRFQLPADARGVMIVDVEKDSPAAAAELQTGDLIMELNRMPVASAADLDAAVKNVKRKKLLLLINRAGTTTFVVLRAK
ncbi:MAG: Do family serine endopeptidase [Candidatus Lernaella stagnicola]|nr:Do family serine endopeptidase [Candidatus Lernaella stagnicola]